MSERERNGTDAVQGDAGPQAARWFGVYNERGVLLDAFRWVGSAEGYAEAARGAGGACRVVPVTITPDED